MEIPTSLIKELRGQSGAGIMDCRNALLQTEGDIDKALEVLKEQGYAKAQKKSTRTASQGLVEAYIHTGGRIGALVEINCETDFVARTDEFKALAHDLAMQVTACSPQFVSEKDIPQGEELDPAVTCLLQQPFIKSPDMTVQDILTEAIARIGENIKVSRFARFEIGD
jgi:elongation factor Ts